MLIVVGINKWNYFWALILIILLQLLVGSKVRQLFWIFCLYNHLIFGQWKYFLSSMFGFCLFFLMSWLKSMEQWWGEMALILYQAQRKRCLFRLSFSEWEISFYVNQGLWSLLIEKSLMCLLCLKLPVCSLCPFFPFDIGSCIQGWPWVCWEAEDYNSFWSSCFSLPSTGIAGMLHCALFYVRLWLNPGLHSCMLGKHSINWATCYLTYFFFKKVDKYTFKDEM